MTLSPVLLQRTLLFLLVEFFAAEAAATFSIAACDTKTGHCGVAVATHNLAVGNGVPFAVFNLGAGVSQFETNPCHAPAALAQLKRTGDAEQGLIAALNREPDCPDGFDRHFRQIAIVAINGSIAAHTGTNAGKFAGQKSQKYVSVQGNGLSSVAVLDAMLSHYQHAEGSLPEKLLGALEAGQIAGGQTIGILSAALRVATGEAWPVDTDLRVDFAPGDAIEHLRVQYDAAHARQLIHQAQRTQSTEQQLALVEHALKRAPQWDRIWLAAARLAAANGDPKRAGERYCQFLALNAVWAQLLNVEWDFSTCR